VSELILVGTVHLDPAGAGCLASILRKTGPSAVTVEISPFSVQFRQGHQEGWVSGLRRASAEIPRSRQAHARLRLLEIQLHAPFEWEVCQAYSRQTGVPCIAVDSSLLARKDLPTWANRLLTHENILGVTEEPDFDLDEHFRQCSARAVRTLQGDCSGWGRQTPAVSPHEALIMLDWLKDTFWKKREEILARRIRRIAAQRTPVVHVGGWMHLIIGTGMATAAELLSDLQPARILVARGEGRTAAPVRLP